MTTRADDPVWRSARAGAGTPRETLRLKDVLTTAAGLICQKGYHGTSMQDIADALGIRKSSLYHHIRTKQDMLFLILDDSIEYVSSGLLSLTDLEIRPSEKLRLAIRNHMNSLPNRREAITVLLKERGSLDPEYAKSYLPKRRRYQKAFQKIVEDGIREGEFQAVDPKLTTLAILGMLNWMVQWYSPEGEKELEDIIELFTDLAMNMLMKR